jgi:hypothetical protein
MLASMTPMHDHTGIEIALIPIPPPMKLRSGADESISIHPLTTNITAHNEKNTFLELLSIDMFHYKLYSQTGKEKRRRLLPFGTVLDILTNKGKKQK